MNKSKRLLLIWAIVLNSLTALSCIGTLIWACVGGIESLYAGFELTKAEIQLLRTQEIVYNALDVALNLSAVICLWLSIQYSEKNFNASKKLFFAGLILNILSSPLSISTILLVIAQFRYMDIKVEKEIREDEVEPEVEIVNDENELKRKIDKLRKLKEEGVITEEEFNNEILKLL